MSDTNWNDLRADGRVVVDAPARKLAIYPNDIGNVVLMSLDEWRRFAYMEVQADEVPALIECLTRAHREACRTDAERTAEYQAFVAVEKAKGPSGA